MNHDDKSEPDVDARVALAAERTVLAWLRTGIALMGFGFVVARLGAFLRQSAAVGAHPTQPTMNASTIGVAIVAAGALVNVWASVRHHQMIRRLVRGEPFHAAPRGPVAVGIASGICGMILVAALLAALLR